MWDKLIHSIPTVFDLLALTTCIGALGFRLWVLPPTVKATDAPDSKVLLIGLWRLLAVCITVLVLSSAVLLAARATEMSSLPFGTILPVLPTVLFKTHYGQVWMVRAAAIAVLWIGWWVGKRHLDSRTISASMLGAGAVIAFTRSASGHAADAGDFRLPELMDWVHLMAASFWGGGLIALFTAVLPIIVKRADQRRTLIANIARRFSSFAGVTLAGVLLTGIYNAWFEVRSFQALWETPYGRTLTAKLLLLLALVILGASNRYISVPLLEQWAGRPLTKRGGFYNSLVVRYLASIQRKLDGVQVARWFVYKMGIEAILIVGVLMCAALLQHEVPPRHLSHTGHAHSVEKSKIEEKKTSAEYDF